MNTQPNLFNLSASDFEIIKSHDICENHNRFERIIKDICLPLVNLDETPSIRLRYIHQIVLYFDSPIGHYMIHTDRECFRRFYDLYKVFDLNRKQYSLEECVIIQEIYCLIHEIQRNNDGIRFNIYKSHSELNRLSEAALDNVLYQYDTFIVQRYTWYLMLASLSHYRYTFQYYLYLNTPIGIYWSVKYPDNYRLVKNGIKKVIDVFRNMPYANLYTYSNQTDVKDDVEIILSDLECLPYRTPENMKKIKYLQSFCKRNNQFFRFRRWIRSREFNEWFYAPNGIGGKMHMRRAVNELNREWNRSSNLISVGNYGYSLDD